MEKLITYTDIRILEKCRRVEEIAEEIYLLLAKAYRSDPQACAVFTKTASEEENHASQFSLAIRMKKGLQVEILMDKDQLEEILQMSESILKEIKINPPPLRKALEDMIMLEEVLSECHLANTMQFKDESSKKLFQAMMSADQDHVGSLKKALACLKG
ncbi:MAG: ferritin family protein [bacterium]|nr:ferritin family protein [bacterium]